MRSMKKSRKLGSQLPRQEIPAARIASSSALVAVADGGAARRARAWMGTAPVAAVHGVGQRRDRRLRRAGAEAVELSTRRLTVAARPPGSGAVATAANATVATSVAVPRLTRRPTASRG